ncbi:THUMP domain-containing class I SAM-dependent RNA methyltransferase [Rubellimicrobium roseum]|uniref:Class I SAM-dependent RNA methyltransferase n=1 Tax=Rubellimicrobium roseum TaxID=687525 RepID=A0A5C4NQ02_9RHOB|nr:class I SAM-dependent RNA methyltransferase [Rubellimicrobium roseum]TNC74737.1 class I SAM-dependent RNA methyltransferase [Rubellimicrobium roseum]
MSDEPFDIFLVAPPGLEAALAAEAAEEGFGTPLLSPGGVTLRGGWPEVWRANLELRGATRVLARLGAFRALHLAQLDKRARKFPWAEVLRRGEAVKVEASCSGSRIYHAGAVVQRIETALREEMGAILGGEDALRVLARVEDDLCTISVDTSGELLHKRGHKEAVNKAPMRETLAALFLRECGYTGLEPVLDPMCGSGTFVIEAAEIALGLPPGRSRAFAFERLVPFDPAAWVRMREPRAPRETSVRFFGRDRDSGAIAMSRANAARAGVEGLTEFACQPIAALERPEGPPGLVIVNPPYGTRIGNKRLLYALHASLGEVLRERFKGWRVGLVTSEPSLARATGLPFAPLGPPVPHGGLKVHLHRTERPLS